MTEAQIRYREYLDSDHWKALRAEAFAVYGRVCFQCGKEKRRLDVHHIRYRHPWESCTVDDVRPCCKKCHRAEHGIVREVSKRRIRRTNWDSNSRANRRRKRGHMEEFQANFG